MCCTLLLLLLLLLLFDFKWVVNPVTAVIQYGTTDNIQTNTHNNNKSHISHKTTQLLGQFTETEHKTAHTINWITTQNFVEELLERKVAV
jgi:hypothetical protein